MRRKPRPAECIIEAVIGEVRGRKGQPLLHGASAMRRKPRPAECIIEAVIGEVRGPWEVSNLSTGLSVGGNVLYYAVLVNRELGDQCRFKVDKDTFDRLSIRKTVQLAICREGSI